MTLFGLLAKPIYAQCPVCVVTVGGGLLVAKKLGIDDLLVSIWLSGLNTALAFWIASKIKKKILNNGYLWTFIFYIPTIVYLTITKQIGHIRNTFLGVDKVLFGITLGMIISVGAIIFDKFLRSKNKGRVFFPYQKVIIPLVILLMFTLFFGILLKKI